MIFLTGSSGFVGSSILQSFGRDYIHVSNRGEDFKIDPAAVVINAAGKAHDTKKVISSHEYYTVNTELTKKIFNAFLRSNAKVFITLSSVKAVADTVAEDLLEDHIPNPITHYGKSKLLSEQFILSQDIPKGKRVYILRPCMIHGPNNKGNLNLLYEIVKKRIPWPLGMFKNKRSFCSIDNLCFIIKELIEREDIPSGIYNIADDDPISTNDLIREISLSLNQSPLIINIPRRIIIRMAKIGDYLRLPLNTERLMKLTESYVVNNKKIISVLKKPLPLSSIEGLRKTLNSFKND